MSRVRKKGGGVSKGNFGHGGVVTTATQVPQATPAASAPASSAADEDVCKVLWIALG